MTPDDEIRQELERVAQSEPRSGREAMAKVTALRTLERLNPLSDEAMVDPQIERLFDETRDPNETARPDDWHPSTDPEVRELDACDTLAARRRWYLNLVEDGSL
jgi:hypothetical protein